MRACVHAHMLACGIGVYVCAASGMRACYVCIVQVYVQLRAAYCVHVCGACLHACGADVFIARGACDKCMYEWLHVRYVCNACV